MSDATYAAAGVDIAAADRAVELMKASIGKTTRPEVVGPLGGFVGLFDAEALKRYDHPLLAASTDGVGTKVAIASMLDKHDTIGLDLVAMVVDDLVVCGAEPLFMTDYIACGKVVPERIATIVRGIADGCAVAGCALIAGETAEHPGLLGPDEYDLAGAATGVVDRSEMLGSGLVKDGDIVIAIESSGLHANGYSLVRHVFFDRAGWRLDRRVPELGRTLGEELIEPTLIYAKDCLALSAAVDVRALAHITGGGLAANLARVVPGGLVAVADRATWAPPPIFGLVGSVGEVAPRELEQAFNMGVGMAAIVAPADADRAVRTLADLGLQAWIAGDVNTAEPGAQRARLVGSHAR